MCLNCLQSKLPELHMQGRHAKGTAKTKPEASAAAPSARLPSHSSFTCFTAPAVASGNTPRQHTAQQQMQTQLQPMSDRQSGTALQADASASYHQQHKLMPVVPLQHNCAVEDQAGHALAAMPPGLASLDHSAQSAVPNSALSSSSVPGEAKSTSCGPNLGSPGAAGVGPALGTSGAACPVLQDPATPSWQGLQADTPPTPLSSHPIDALDESESAPSGTDSSALSPAHSKENSVPADNQQSRPNTPVSLSHHQSSAHSSAGNSDQQSHGQAVNQHPQQQTAHHSQQQQQQHQASTLSDAQTSAAPQLRQASSSLGSDAVVLDFASELSGSNNGLISPSSSVASWQRALSQLGSESSQKFTSFLSQTQERAFASSQQNSPEALWSRPEAVGSRASAHSPGLFPDFAPMFASTPLPGAWQQHHLPSPSSSPSPTGCQQDQSAEQPVGSAWEPYSEAAAQLSAAVTHAVKLLTASQAAPADLRTDLSNTAAALRSPPSLSLGSNVPTNRSHEQCQLSFEGFQQPYRRDAFRRSAQSSSSQTAVWVPQAEMQMQSCAEGLLLQINGTGPPVA